VIGLLLWLLSWFFLSGASTEFRQWISNKVDVVAVNSGLSLKNILIEGRYYTDVSMLKEAVALEKGGSILSIDPAAIQENLIALPWVRQAYVKKIWPDTISVALKERVPMALFQKSTQVRLIDTQGEVIDENNLSPYKDLIIVSGVEANKAASTLFPLITANNDLYDEIERAIYISERRWDILLKNETLIKLPENDVAFALKILEDANDQDSLLSKNLEIIDLRDPNRIVIKAKPGQMENYNPSGNVEGSSI